MLKCDMTVVAQLLVPHSSWPEHWSSASQSPSPSPHSLDTQYVAHHSLDTRASASPAGAPHLVVSLPQHPSPPRQYMLRLAAAVVVIITSSALEPTSGSSR